MQVWFGEEHRFITDVYLMKKRSRQKPDWDALYEIASTQEGYFSRKQAAEAGYSSPLLYRHIKGGKFSRSVRGVYRLVYFPPGDHEDLVTIWLWSGRQGVFSHETALALHGLSDVLPARIYLTLPARWSTRRLRLPKGVVAHYADVQEQERSWVGSVPVTKPVRALHDCVASHLSPELLKQALDDGLKRGLFAARDVAKVSEYLSGFAVEG